MFGATANLLISSVLDTRLERHASNWLPKAYAIFDDLTSSGNMVAITQKEELMQLESMLGQVAAGRHHLDPEIPPEASAVGVMTSSMSAQSLPLGTVPMSSDAALQLPGPEADFVFTPVSDLLTISSFENVFTSAQILDVANSIDTCDMEWMSRAVVDYEL